MCSFGDKWIWQAMAVLLHLAVSMSTQAATVKQHGSYDGSSIMGGYHARPKKNR